MSQRTFPGAGSSLSEPCECGETATEVVVSVNSWIIPACHRCALAMVDPLAQDVRR